MLLVAQSSGQTGILQVHRPETCYPASGYQLSPVTPRLVPTSPAPLPTNSLTATADGVPEHILYWTRVGYSLPMSWRDQRLAVALQNLRGLIPDAVLIRVSTRRNDAAGAYAALDEFVQSMLEAVPANLRQVFVV
jgi:EpsI family protein